MNGKFLTLIQESLLEGLLTWFLLGRVLRRVVAMNQRAGILCPRSPRGTDGKGAVFQKRRTFLWQSVFVLLPPTF